MANQNDYKTPSMFDEDNLLMATQKEGEFSQIHSSF